MPPKQLWIEVVPPTIKYVAHPEDITEQCEITDPVSPMDDWGGWKLCSQERKRHGPTHKGSGRHSYVFISPEIIRDVFSGCSRVIFNFCGPRGGIPMSLINEIFFCLTSLQILGTLELGEKQRMQTSPIVGTGTQPGHSMIVYYPIKLFYPTRRSPFYRGSH